jgi:putative PEP-CTERM system histidine kinase
MAIQHWQVLPNFVGSILACGLAALLWLKASESAFYRTASVMLGATALANFAAALEIIHTSSVLSWLRIEMGAELIQVVALLYIGVALLDPSELGGGKSARARARAAAVLALLLGILIATDHLAASAATTPLSTSVDVGSAGIVFYTFTLLCSVVGIAQLEMVLRTLEDPLRYELKFVLIGLGGLAGYQVYKASQLIVLPIWNTDEGLTQGMVTILCLSLVAFGLGRTRLRKVKEQLYISPQALLGSITLILAGLYLLGVGIVAEWIRWTGWEMGATLSALAVFCGVIALVVTLVSRSIRAEVRLFLARHFYRSKYDYRSKWLEVTEAFRGADSLDIILDRLLAILGRTFSASKISIWMFYEADRHFHRVRSINAGMPPRPIPLSDPVIQQLLSKKELISMKPSSRNSSTAVETDERTLREITQATTFVPILADRELVATITLGGEPQGATYGVDDCDLLRAIAGHVGLLLSNARLAEERTAAAELEALHRFAAFCLHDLKNLAARLSLVLQNAEVHGDNPEFQRAAMKTVRQSVNKLMALVSKLSVRPSKGEHAEMVDVNSLISETIASLNGDIGLPLRQTFSQVAPVCGVREQLQEVVLNLILNAQQAGGEQNEVGIATAEQNNKVVITVTDKGSGISPERLRTLFHPFQTTKKEGMGIGLYQCRQIVQAHGGTLTVESALGTGTTVRVELPPARQALRRQ